MGYTYSVQYETEASQKIVPMYDLWSMAIISVMGKLRLLLAVARAANIV